MRILFICTSLFLFIACKKPVKTNDSSIMMDVSYGTNALQKMDVYLPAGRTSANTKLMILVHGGGWTEGDKADFTPYIAMLQTRLPGYAFININYRLAGNGQNVFPAQENDIQAAMAFIFNKKEEYQVSDKWVLLGASAGAHLAMLQAYKYSSPVIPKAIVSFFGPADLTAMYNSNPFIALALVKVLGTTPGLNAALYQQSSPLTFISPQSPPTLLLQGGADNLVPPGQAILVKDKLQSLGIPNQYVLYPTAGHGWTGPDLDDSFNKIAAFVSLHVQ